MTAYFEQLTIARSLLEAIPFEQYLRGRSVVMLQARLEAERNLFRDFPVDVRFRLLFILDEATSIPEALITLRSWALQSFPMCETAIIATRGAEATDLRKLLEADEIARALAIVEHGSVAQSNTFLLFAQAGDLFHPSLAAALAFRFNASPRDVFVWNCCQYMRGADGSFNLTRLLRRPQLQKLTLLNEDYIGRTFAVHASMFDASDDRSIARLWREGGHALKVRLALEAEWETHPEFLTLFPERDVNACGGPMTKYHALERLAGAPLRETGKARPRWQPSSVARSVSVVIPFRDRPELTLRAISSVCLQRYEGEIEIVLINNHSSEQSLSVLNAGLRTLGAQAKRLDYPKAFNHSRQCNLGAQAAKGEVILFLNNDAEFVSIDLLEGMGRWSLLDRVATVGCRIESYNGNLVCAGQRARLDPGYHYHSMIEESRDPEYAQQIREVIGNTFACAAIRRDVFLGLGGLNELEFPNGYNDVEFCLRALGGGYRHLYLGHLVIRHQPGTSRGASDEIYQKILLRQRYPWVMREAMFQLESDDHLLRSGISRDTKRVGKSLRQTLERLIRY
jgi:GT2 family glycosyltransferase